MSTQRIQSVVRNGATTTAAALHNSPANANTNFTSESAPVDPGKVVLLSGLLRSPDGGGAVGYRWAKDGVGGASGYLGSSENAGFWQTVNGILEPPMDATGFVTVLANKSSTGAAYFDDILVLALDRPGPAE